MCDTIESRPECDEDRHPQSPRHDMKRTRPSPSSILELEAESYLVAVVTGKLSEMGLAILYNCFNVWRECIAEAVEVGRSF